MAFTISIEQFEGPLDLMLHLIKENKLDLFDLDMDILTTQYLNYLKEMEAQHLEIASEFLTELAGLIEYKSKKLLPREKVVIEEEYEVDEKERLMERLLEYQRYKEVKEQLQSMYEERALYMSRPQTNEVSKYQVESDEHFQSSPYELMKAMQKLMHRKALQDPYETKVEVKELSLDERIEQIQERLHGFDGVMSFEQLCDDCTNLHMVIVTFLAILDLIKYRVLSYELDEHEEIYIRKGAGHFEGNSTDH